MQIVKTTITPEEEIVRLAISHLKAGNLIIYPTETVYGVGVDATNNEAVAKLLAYKTKREGKPISIAVDSVRMAERFVNLNEEARKVYQRFLPGPITVISQSLPKSPLATGIASEFDTVGVRWPAHKLAQSIVTAFGKPMTATSANQSYQAAPYEIGKLLANLSEKQKSLIGLIIDAGQLPKRPPSTIIDTTTSTPIRLRTGTNKIGIDLQKKAEAFTSESVEQTQQLAGKILLQQLPNIAKRGLLITLDGELGAGKTVLAQALAKYLGVTERVVSPTYNYVEEYDFARPGAAGKLYHADVWRLDNANLLAELQPGDWLGAGKVAIVEWYDIVANWPPFNSLAYMQPAPSHVAINIASGGTDKPNKRLITIAIK